MNKHIYKIRKWVFILYPAIVITFAIPTQLFAQNLPFPKPDPTSGSPDRTGGAGGRVKPEIPSPSVPRTNSGGYKRPIFRNDINRDLYRYQKPTRLKFPLEEDIQKRPLRKTSGKAGGSCVRPDNDKPFLNALIPPKKHLGQTSKEQVTFFLYIPQTTAIVGDFILFNNQNDQNNEVYQTEIQLPKTPGIIKITLPESVKLEDSKTYRWYFVVVCDPIYGDQDEYVDGSIQKIQLDTKLTNYLLKATPLEQAKIYAKNGIWYDTLEAIAKVKQEHPLDWESLLESVGLQQLSQEPFIDSK